VPLAVLALFADQPQNARRVDALGAGIALEGVNGLADAVRRLLDDPAYRSRAHRHYSYVARGMYAEQLDRWLQLFSRDQLLVLESSDLFLRPAQTMTRVHDFLGLDDEPSESFPVAQNAISRSRIPPAAAERLRERFREPNERLFSMLGQRWAWNDA